jgi:hypothetical protein
MPAADTIQPAVRRKLPYDLERDFAPVGRMVYGPWLVIVHASVPARNMKDLIALAKAAPGKLNYATSGTGSSAHLAAELLSSITRISMVHIPYKGTSDGVVAVATGQADMIFASIPAATPLLAAGRVRALAITTGRRSSLAPNMPTLIESGVPGYDRRLVRHARSRCRSARDRRATERNHRQGHEHARRAGNVQAPGTGSGADHARGIRRVHQERGRAEYQSREGSRDKSRVGAIDDWA